MVDLTTKIKTLYNQFDGKNLDLLDKYYALDVSFCDPAFKIEGLDNLKKYYAHAYQHVTSIEFIFSDIVHADNKYCATWVMNIAINRLNGGRVYSVNGVSVLQFNKHGLIRYHRDYLDLGEMLYERIPMLGFIIRKIKARLGFALPGAG